VHTSSYRSVHGRTLLAAILDEVAFWPNDVSGANPDYEILTALRPALARVPGSILIAISTPFSKRGVLWEAYRKHYGVDSNDLTFVWRALTRAMNENQSQDEVTAALQENEFAARAEWLAEFRADIEAFVRPEVIEACTVVGRHECRR
jgi:hypothetical protein